MASRQAGSSHNRAQKEHTLSPDELGRALREGKEPFLKNRRWIVGLALYKINGSAQAYEILQTPDAVLTSSSYAATAVLAAMGPPDRVQTLP